jgi:hypothetical protein
MTLPAPTNGFIGADVLSVLVNSISSCEKQGHVSYPLLEIDFFASKKHFLAVRYVWKSD